MIVKYETEHYTFNYIKDSLAGKEIIEIACEQEKCFNKICDVLKIKYPRKISYWFYSSPEVLGEYLCEGNPCNGISITDDVCADIGKKISLDGSGENSFVIPPYSIHAVYNGEIKCVGEHEDTHMIAAEINEPTSDFLCESLAQFMDGKWWGKTNKHWVCQFIEEDRCPKPSEMIGISTYEFWEHEAKISYPLAGAWVEFFIEEYGVDKFLKVYSLASGYLESIKAETGDDVTKIDERFLKWICRINE